MPKFGNDKLGAVLSDLEAHREAQRLVALEPAESILTKRAAPPAPPKPEVRRRMRLVNILRREG